MSTIRLDVFAEGDAGGAKSKQVKKLLGRHSKKELIGVQGWMYKKYRAVRHAAHGTFNRVAKVCPFIADCSVGTTQLAPG